MNTQCNHCTLLSPHHQHWRPPRNAAKTSHPLQPLAFFSLPGGKPRNRRTTAPTTLRSPPDLPPAPAEPPPCLLLPRLHSSCERHRPPPRNPHPPYRGHFITPPALTVLPRGRLSSRPPPALEPPRVTFTLHHTLRPRSPTYPGVNRHTCTYLLISAITTRSSRTPPPPIAAKPPTCWPATVHQHTHTNHRLRSPLPLQAVAWSDRKKGEA